MKLIPLRKNKRLLNANSGEKVDSKRRKLKCQNPFLRQVIELKQTIPNWDNFFGVNADSNRLNEWVRLEVLGEPLAKKYAWAIPDERSLKILSNFTPLVELGCGKGYWSRLLQEKGVDILPYDQYVPENAWTKIYRGGPEILSKSKIQNRNLFLCYPDEATNLGIECLKYFNGQYIIHVGELIHTSTFNGSAQSPWGRTTSSEFQVFLSKYFHCLLQVRITSFPFSNDHITVWKRSRRVSGDTDNDDIVNNSNSIDEINADIAGDAEEEHQGGTVEVEDTDIWRDIPVDERLPDYVGIAETNLGQFELPRVHDSCIPSNNPLEILLTLLFTRIADMFNHRVTCIHPSESRKKEFWLGVSPFAGKSFD
eukprot:gene4312-8574_t